MTYSVFNWQLSVLGKPRYDYFETDETLALGDAPPARAGLPKAAKSTPGLALEAVLPIVPSRARTTGFGPRAIGRVAVRETR